MDAAAVETPSNPKVPVPKVPVELARPLYAFVFAEDPEVRACERQHGDHAYVLINVVYAEGGDEYVWFCKRCGVRQCLVPVIEDDPISVCLLARGHSAEKLHRDDRNRWREVAQG